jgi:hypothetical protein
MLRFQESIKIKLLEVGTSIEVKCKKAVETKITAMDQENNNKASNKQQQSKKVN